MFETLDWAKHYSVVEDCHLGSQANLEVLERVFSGFKERVVP